MRQPGRPRLPETEQWMITVLDELGLTGLVTSITGLSPAGAAPILAQTGDPARFMTGRALDWHSGLAPRQKASGSYAGRTRTTGQAHAVLAAALLRQLHAVIPTGRRWHPAIAAGGRDRQAPIAA